MHLLHVGGRINRSGSTVGIEICSTAGGWDGKSLRRCGECREASDVPGSQAVKTEYTVDAGSAMVPGGRRCQHGAREVQIHPHRYGRGLH
jgi:hypothetical protein